MHAVSPLPQMSLTNPDIPHVLGVPHCFAAFSLSFHFPSLSFFPPVQPVLGRESFNSLISGAEGAGTARRQGISLTSYSSGSVSTATAISPEEAPQSTDIAARFFFFFFFFLWRRMKQEGRASVYNQRTAWTEPWAAPGSMIPLQTRQGLRAAPPAWKQNNPREDFRGTMWVSAVSSWSSARLLPTRGMFRIFRAEVSENDS